MAALLAWLGRRPDSQLAEGRFVAALARMADWGPAGCARLSRPGFELAVLRAGTPSEQAAGPQPRAARSTHGGPELIAALDGWLIETAAAARELGLPGPGADSLELLLAAYRQRAHLGLLVLRGHFVGLLYDTRSHELFVCRDPGGARALYVRTEPEGCWLASDEAALVEGSLEQALDPTQLLRYFSALAPQSGCGWFRDVRALAPGELWQVSDGQARCLLRQGLPEISVTAGDGDAIEQYRLLLQQAVARSTHGVTGGIAVSLSGGLDSLGVAALATRAGVSLATLSWRLSATPGSDEGAAVRAAAQALQLPLTQFDGDALTPCSGGRFVAKGELLSNIYRELKQELYQRAQQGGSRLLLNGDFGDHLYGIPRHWLRDALHSGHWLAAFAEFGWRGWQRPAIWRDPALRHCVRSWLGLPVAAAGLSSRLRVELTTSALLAARGEASSRETLLRGSYTARAQSSEHLHSERLGLELRSPLRDPELLGFALAMPPQFAQRRGVRKWIARQALREVLPEPWLSAEKSGDLQSFLRAALAGRSRDRVGELLLQPDARWPEFVDRDSLLKNLHIPNSSTEPELLLLWLCSAFEQWRRACAHPVASLP